jgi:hypothetical protein
MGKKLQQKIILQRSKVQNCIKYQRKCRTQVQSLLSSLYSIKE